MGSFVFMRLKDPNHSCVNRSTTHDPRSNGMLEMAYSKGPVCVIALSPILTMESTRRGSNYTSTNWQGLCFLVDSFPMPPGSKQTIWQVGNEFNACNEWRCKRKPSSQSLLTLQRIVVST